MGRIYCIMGKSAVGKDTVFRALLQNKRLELQSVILYTTRPIRGGEQDGVEYYFADESQYQMYEMKKKIIESRAYETVHGIWRYFTVEDGQVDLTQGDYLIIGTLESFQKIQLYYGKEWVEAIYLNIDDGIRLQRALDREKAQENPKYLELCRRFIADAEDFSELNLVKSGVSHCYNQEDTNQCIEEIQQRILLNKKRIM